MLHVKGRVVQGSKRGAYFVSLYKDRLVKACGFDPFPGTLNIECSDVPRMPSKANFISSFTRQGKEFGAVWCYPATIFSTAAAVVVPEETHHNQQTIEVISRRCLRTEFNLKNGDYVKVTIDGAD